MTNIYDYIEENPDSTIKEIAQKTGITEDQVRHRIKKEGDRIIKTIGRPARYSTDPDYNIENEMSDIEEEADIEDLEKAIKEDKPKRKILTSQSQLNKMANNCWVLEIKMEYSRQERYWNFTKGDVEIKVKSKELPAIRENLSQWIEENFK